MLVLTIITTLLPLNFLPLQFLKNAMSLHLSMPLLRHFLRTSSCKSGLEVIKKACRDGEPGAISIILLAVKVRGNRRTRRTFQQVRDAALLARPPRWFTVLSKQIGRLYDLLKSMCVPRVKRATNQLSLALSRSQSDPYVHTYCNNLLFSVAFFNFVIIKSFSDCGCLEFLHIDLASTAPLSPYWCRPGEPGVSTLPSKFCSLGAVAAVQ